MKNDILALSFALFAFALGIVCGIAIKSTNKQVRAVVLENNTVTYCNIPSNLSNLFKENDTVWLNLDTHQIDDTCDSAMKAVLFSN